MSSILDTVGGTTFVSGFQGQLTGPVELAKIETRINENATGIDIGVPVCRGAAQTVLGAPGNCKPMVSGGKLIGLSSRALSEMNASTGSTVLYVQFKDVPILKDGDIRVLAVENVTEGDDVIGVVASPTGCGGTTGGAADGTTRLAFLAAQGQCQWQETVASGQVGLVRIKCV